MDLRRNKAGKAITEAKCPYCGKNDGFDSGHNTTFDGQFVTCEGSCANCNRDWMEHYKISAVTDENGNDLQ